jgi:hypothetical protein
MVKRMVKFVCFILILMLLTTSGCCELFGLCTSVSVHTSADSPNQFTGSDLQNGFKSSGLTGSSATAGIYESSYATGKAKANGSYPAII